ncbi:DNA-binding protein [Salipiger aestuarii]|uniref:Zn-ribbon domain-containing OB-fold protein n=1 Tax=Salipiger aestuarii TaxID=568098 RepID=UPI00123AEA3C|nr:OB-fold domain-containing protein [Salipiger aestuarii]KAA8607485.1 DNA-binding protein [Salipiger aestuarii]
MTGMQKDQGPDAVFAAKLAEGVFEIQKCNGCGAHVFHPRVICPACGSADLGWVAPTGQGTVYARTIVRRKPERGGDYNVVLVDLQEGVRMMSRVDGIAHDEIAAGLKVSATIGEGPDGEPAVVFRPEGEAR